MLVTRHARIRLLPRMHGVKAHAWKWMQDALSRNPAWHEPFEFPPIQAGPLPAQAARRPPEPDDPPPGDESIISQGAMSVITFSCMVADHLGLRGKKRWSLRYRILPTSPFTLDKRGYAALRRRTEQMPTRSMPARLTPDARVLSRMVENLGCLHPVEIAQVKCILDRTIA